MQRQSKSVSIVTSYPILEEPVVRNRLLVFARQFLAYGWSVKICSCSPSAKQSEEIQFEGITICSIHVPAFRKNGFFTRVLLEAYYAFRLFRVVSKDRPDCVLVSVPSILLLLFPFFRVSRYYILDVRDLVWEYLGAQGPIGKIVSRFFRRAAGYQVGRAHLTLVTNQSELEYIERNFSPPELVLVSNGISRAQFEKVRGLPVGDVCADKLRVSYIGNVGIAQNLEVLVRAVSALPFVEASIVGDGADLTRLRNLSQRLSASNVTFTGRVPWDDVLDYYRNTDILYTQLSESFASAVPSKLYEYLATGRPVIYGGTGAALRFLKEFDGVALIEPDHIGSLTEALRKEYEKKKKADRTVRLYPGNISLIESRYIREQDANAMVQLVSVKIGT